MEFIYKRRKRVGDKISTLVSILEEAGINLDYDEMTSIVNLCMNDEFPDYFYKEGLLDLDMIEEDPECIYDYIN